NALEIFEVAKAAGVDADPVKAAGFELHRQEAGAPLAPMRLGALRGHGIVPAATGPRESAPHVLVKRDGDLGEGRINLRRPNGGRGCDDTGRRLRAPGPTGG